MWWSRNSRRRVKSPEVAETTFTMSTIEEEMEGVSCQTVDKTFKKLQTCEHLDMTSVQVSIRQENEPWEHPKKGPSQNMSQRRVSTSVTMCHGEILLPCERLISVLDMPCFCNKKLDFKCLCYILPSSHKVSFCSSPFYVIWVDLCPGALA